jgi:predicted dehydrogenase
VADRLRVGVVGVGWGSLVHVPAFRAVDDFEPVALCSRNADRVREAGARLGIDDTSTDWRRFVERGDLDVVSIATPVALHHPITLATLGTGKHVLCEKPLAPTAAEAAEMVAVAATSHGRAATCFELRWSKDRLAVWEMVRAGYLGIPYVARLHQSAAYWHPSHAPQAPWMYRLEEGGGYLNGLVSHDIDFACTLFGEPVAVCAEVKTTVTPRPMADGSEVDVTADDTVGLLLRIQGDVSVMLTAAVVGVHTSGYRFEACGSDGTIIGTGGRGAVELAAGHVNDERLAEVPLSSREPRSRPELSSRRASAAIRSMALMLEDWSSELRGEEACLPAPTLRDGWRVQAVIDAARSSAAGGGWVQIPPLAG